MKTNVLVRTEEMKCKGYTLYIRAGLSDHFSLTYEKRNKRCYFGGGCAAHSADEEVRRAIELFGLEPIERVHLCNDLGQPSFVLKNGVYFAKTQPHVLQRYLRLNDGEAEIAKNIFDEIALFVFLRENHIFERWENEAQEAIAAIINGREIEYEREEMELPVNNITERYREEKEKLLSGYYTPRRMDCHKRTKLNQTTLLGSRFNEVDYTDQIGSTVTLMEYIRDYGIDPNINTHFQFKNHECLVVSEEVERDVYVDKPVEQWHDVFGMKRIKVSCGWYAFINGKYYYIS